MKLSLGVGVLMFAAKTAAYWVTGSAAIFSDAAESIVHVAAVAFATFSLWLAFRPASARFLYGYERIGFFSAGFEGAAIAFAALAIIIAAVEKWITGITLEHLGPGTLVVAGAGVVNTLLGLYLVRLGRRNHSLILEANGRHVLTDSWTSAGVVVGLCLVLWTGWKPFDPLCAIAVAANILWSGGKLIARAAGGLMDYANPATATLLRERLDALSREIGADYHGLRFRDTGQRLLIEFHLLFPGETTLEEAHRRATAIEYRLVASLPVPAEVITHLESEEDHASVHDREGFIG